jgi:putative flippase GtrA
MVRLIGLKPQFVVFIAGGGLSALVDIGVMQLLIMNQVSALAATSAGFVAGLGVNYAFHSKVTFKNVINAGTLARFICVVGINYMLTLAMVAVSLALFQNALIGKLVSLPVVAVNGFFLSKHWIFK